MKILQISTTCSTGSVGRIEVDIYKLLKQKGHDCMIAYGRGLPPNNVNTMRIGNDWDIWKNGLRTRCTDQEGLGSQKATKEFINKIKKYDPDIIHLHCLHGYYINIEILFNYLKEANKKIVWTYHDCWAFTGHCTHFDYIGCDKWKKGCNNCPQKKEYPKSVFFDNSKQNYQKKKALFTSVKDMTIVTPSYWLASLVEASFLSKYPIETIHNGIDLEVFKPTESDFRQRYSCEDKTIVLGVANRWGKRKGLDAFLQLSKKLSKEFQIVLVGLSKKQVKELPENIVKIERTNSTKELAEIYTAADVFVNPTLEDSFPTTNLEAQACGTCVITYNTGGSPESLSYGNGIIVKKENINQLKKKIIESNAKRRNIRLTSEYDKNINFAKYLQLYKKIL